MFNIWKYIIFKIGVTYLLHYIINVDIIVDGSHCELKKYNGQTLCSGTLKSFVEKTGADNPFPQPLSPEYYLIPAFYDLDEDGRIDMLLGTNNNLNANGLIYFKNTLILCTCSTLIPWQTTEMVLYHLCPTKTLLRHQTISSSSHPNWQ